jgi:glucosamine-6-phosphate deaminase
MKLIKVKNYRELSRRASEIIIKEVSRKPNLVIGFATGKTPLGLYRKLAKAYKKNKIDFSKIKTFNLDEHYPLKKNDRKSYHNYMFRHLFNKINAKKENINLLNGEAKNFKKECEDYEKKIRKNPIDIQILGIGANGHIGFNEPGSDFNSKTRLVDLSPETIKEKKFLTKALTMGISTIMKSKKIILLASGKKKANAVLGLVKGKIGKNCPASFLRKHKNLIVIIDEKAGSLL